MSLFFVQNSSKSLQISNCTLLRNEFLDNFSPGFRIYQVNSVVISLGSFRFNNNLNPSRNGSTLIIIEEFSSAEIFDSSFSNNYAFSTTAILDFRNLLKNDPIAIIILSNCSFYNNVANYSMYLRKDQISPGVVISITSKSSIDVSSCNFLNNSISLQNPSSDASGPCIFAQDDEEFNSSLRISNSFFSQNLGFATSSCIHYQGNFFSVINSIFTSNSIYPNKTLPDSYGNSLWKKGSNIFINVLSANFAYCTFDQAVGIFGSVLNLLLNFGFDQVSNISNLGHFNFTNFVSTNAQSLNDGGVIQIEVLNFPSQAIFSFINCRFENSLAVFHGGVFKIMGMFSLPSKMTFINCNFLSNVALKGGVFSNIVFQNSLVFNNSNFIGNQAVGLDEGGGVIYNLRDQSFYTNKCSFFHNFAVFRASIAHMHVGSFFDENSLYFNNTSGSDAGMIFLMIDALISFSNCKIENSFSYIRGGFAITQEQCTLIVNNCSLNNISSSTDSFIYSGQESNVHIFNSNLSNFYSYDGMGEIVTTLGVENILEFENCSFISWQSVNRSHFQIRSSKFILRSCSILDSTGLFLFSRFSDIFIDNITIAEYNCFNTPDSEYCLFSLVNVNLFLNGLQMHDVTLTNKQSLVTCLDCLMNVTKMNISSVLTVNPFTLNVLYMNALFFIKESTYNFTNCFVSYINVTTFQIILASGLFDHFTVNNSLELIEGQFISCFFCIKLEISFCNINGTSSDMGPVLQINDIYESFFFQTLIGYSADEIEEESKAIYIHDSVFCNNFALVQGGVLYILDFSLLIENCVFYGNTAVQGGAIYFNCTDFNNKMTCKWNITSSRFVNNSASLRGAVFHWLNRAPSSSNNFYENNTGRNGSIFSSNPIKLQVDISDENESFISGYRSNSTLQFFLLDAYNQTYYDTMSLGYLTFDKTHSKTTSFQKFIGNQFQRIQNGAFSFDDFNIISHPGNDAYLLVYSDAITSVSPYVDLSSTSPHRNISNVYNYAISIHIRNCLQGEIYMNDANLCFPCPDGSYSFDPADNQCHECPSNAICLKNQPFKVSKGYWRLSPNTSKIYRCNIKKAGCVGGPFETQCALGYTGPLCSGCLFNSTMKYFNSFGGCSKCGSSNTFLILITVTILLLGMVGLIFFSIKDSQTFMEHEDLKEVLVTVLINILINYTQLFSVISNIDIKWPEFFSSSSSSSSSPTSITDFIGIIECPIADFAHGHNYSIFYVEMVMMAFLFFLMLIGNLIFWFIFKLIRRRYKKKAGATPETSGKFRLKNNIILTYIAIYVLMLQPLLNFFTKGFSCIEVGDGSTTKHFLKVAPAIECWEDTHISLIKNVIVPFILVFIIPPPVYMLYYIAKNKRNPEKEIIQRLFMVTVGYKNRYCYWEFVILLKKIILMYLSIFIRDEPVICVLTLLFVLLIFCNLHLIYKPYEYEFLNNLIVEQYVALFVCYSVFLYFSYSDSVSANAFLIFIMLCANVVFFGHWAYYFYVHFKQSLQNLRNALKKTTESVKQITSSALKRFENSRRKAALIRSQSTLSKQKFTPRGSKCLNNDDAKKILRTTPGKSNVGSHEDCEIIDKAFISERKMDDKGDENLAEKNDKFEKFPGMLIIKEEK